MAEPDGVTASGAATDGGMQAAHRSAVWRAAPGLALLLAGIAGTLALGPGIVTFAVLLAGAAALGLLIRRLDLERRLITTSLRESEERFRSITALSADWYWEQDANQRFSFLSTEADLQAVNRDATTVGFLRRELPGIDLASADWDEHEAHCRKQLPYRDFTYRRVAADGSEHWLKVSGEPVFDGQGAFLGYRGVAADITRQRQAEQEIRRRKDLYEALSRTNQAIIHLRDRQALFEEVCRVAVEYGHFCLAWIGIVDDGGWILPKAIHGPVSDVYRRMRVSTNPDVPEGKGFAGAAVRDNRFYVVNDFLNEPRVAPWREQALAAGVRSLATFPLHCGDICVGVINLHGDEVGFFSEELVKLLEEMAANISFALTNMERDAERAAALSDLEASERRFSQLAASVPEIFWIADYETGRVTYVSPAYEAIFGRSASSLQRDPAEWLAAVHPADRAQVEAHRALMRSGSTEQEFRIVRPDGQVRWLHNRSFNVSDAAGRIMLVTGIAEDITARKSDEQKLQHLAHYDNLTELPNRSLFFDRLQQTIVHSARSRRLAGVVFVDVDHFKHVNDTLGHPAGDRLLLQVARRLESAVRSGDTVGRLGGDEFAIILSNLSNANDAGVVAQKLMSALHEPFEIEGRELFVTASAGVTLYPDDSEDPDTLLKNADVAMYRAKELGRNTFQFFKAEMNARALERMSMEGHLRRALERDEFLLHFQPKAHLASGEITGLEALIRWQHPDLGLVSPVRFIPLLEENGMIVEVGEWVLRQVCRQIAKWAGTGITVVPVAVNLSGRQLQQKDIGRILRSVLAEERVDSRLIELEITESVLMRNAEQTSGILRGLQAAGIRLSVDDFGTGYSSLNYLKSFPLDALKVDRSFVRDIVTDPDDAMITRAVISMAHSLRLKVVAEGVETIAQLSMLAAAGCDEIQGYYFSKPLPADECGTLLRERRKLGLSSPTASGEPTLLVVDDDANMLGLYERVLRHEGLRILKARDGQEALHLLATNEVSVVVADQRMPGMDGTELLRRVRGLYPDTVRIVMSGALDVQTMTEAINQGAVYKVLIKSSDHEQLRASVKEAVAYKALQDENRRLADRVRALEADSLLEGIVAP